MIEYYTKPYKNYFNFKGRARRKEYWLFLLINIIIVFIFIILDSLVNSDPFNDN